MAQKSSFQRKIKAKESIAGCFPSLYTHHLLVSTGVPDIDDLIGGGLPIGTVLLVEEDYSGGYAKLLLKYFLSEGVYHRHSLFLASLTQNPESLVQNLPSFQENTETKELTGSKEDEQMKIAWRYQNKLSGPSENEGSRRSFNLLVPIPRDILDQCDIVTCDLNQEDVPSETHESLHKSDESVLKNPNSIHKSDTSVPKCDKRVPKSIELLRKLYSQCREKGFLVENNNKEGKRNILRIGIHCLGDILWGETSQQILTFMLALKSMLRTCYGVAVITVPSTVYDISDDIRSRLESCADVVIHLNSFDSQETVNPAYKDYHGIISVKRIGSIGVLTPPLHLLKEDAELVYKSRRNRFLVERFHLPPELGTAPSRDQADPRLKQHRTNIDF